MATLKTATRLALGAICLVLSTGAHASDVLTLDGNLAPPDYSFYTYTDIYGVTHNSIPIGPYIANLNGDGYNNAAVLVFCYDYASPTPVGTPFSGSLVPVTDFSDPTYTAMMQATYLIDELTADGLLNAPLATRGAISMAIWEITNASSHTRMAQFPTDPAAIPYEEEAAIAVADLTWTTADAAMYPTWIPDDTLIQRFGGVVADPSAAPEPGTLVFVGGGYPLDSGSPNG